MRRRRTSRLPLRPAVRALLATLALAASAGHAAAAAAASRPPRDLSFWLALKAQDFKVPAGERAAALTREVITLNASTDPQLRDGVGYEAFVTWVYRDQLLTAAELRSLLPPLLAAAGAGLGEAHGDGIFARSFALLDGRALRCRGDDAAPEAELLAR